MWPFKPRCIHDWYVLDKTVFPSVYETLGEEKAAQLKSMIMAMFTKKAALTVACKKCGELRINTEEGPF